MINIVLEIAKQNPYGFTFNIRTKKMVKFGISVAYEATQNSFDLEGLKKVLEHSKDHDGIVGGWLNSENNKYYFDSIKVFKDLDEAIKFGKENNQIAVFDLTNLKEIILK